MVCESIISEVKEIIVDDFNRKQQLLVLRYYYYSAVHENFLDFNQATELNAEGLCK